METEEKGNLKKIKIELVAFPIFLLCIVGMICFIFGTHFVLRLFGSMAICFSYFILSVTMLLSEEKYRKIMGVIMVLISFGLVVYLRDSFVEAFKALTTW